MDVTITITITDAQRDAILAQLARTGSSETPPQLVSRLTQKMINAWVLNNRQELRQRNEAAIQALMEQIADDPNRDAILAALGWQFVGGLLQRLPGSP